MYLLYLDDSGSLTTPNDPYYVLAGVAVFERVAYFLHQSLDEVARSLFPDAPETELHASEIWARSDKDQTWRRNAIRATLSALVQSNQSTTAFACAIERSSYDAEQCFDIALGEVCGRFDKMLQRWNRDPRQLEPERGLVLLDRSDTADPQSLAKFLANGRSTSQTHRFFNLADIPLLVDSKNSRMMQLADHIAYATRRRYADGDTSYFDLIATRFDTEGGRIHGLVHRTPGWGSCGCTACFAKRAMEEAAEQGR